MDYNQITSQEGYRVEDLSENNQKIMNYLYNLLISLNEADVDSVDVFGEEMIDDESILGKALKEIKDKFKKECGIMDAFGNHGHSDRISGKRGRRHGIRI